MKSTVELHAEIRRTAEELGASAEEVALVIPPLAQAYRSRALVHGQDAADFGLRESVAAALAARRK